MTTPFYLPSQPPGSARPGADQPAWAAKPGWPDPTSHAPVRRYQPAQVRCTSAGQVSRLGQICLPTQPPGSARPGQACTGYQAWLALPASDQADTFFVAVAGLGSFLQQEMQIPSAQQTITQAENTEAAGAATQRRAGQQSGELQQLGLERRHGDGR